MFLGSSALRMSQKPMLLARPVQSFTFTRAYKKVILTKDVDNLGFAGEICFVKPGYALNSLVPNHQLPNSRPTLM